VADEQKNLKSVLVFPGDFLKAYTKCKEGAVVDIEYGKTKDGATVFRNAS
jgi:hypothetical protein